MRPQLAVASAVAVALMVALCQGLSSPGLRPSGNSAMLTAALSNQNTAVYLVSSHNQEWNQPTAGAFRTTNLGVRFLPSQQPSAGR